MLGGCLRSGSLRRARPLGTIAVQQVATQEPDERASTRSLDGFGFCVTHEPALLRFGRRQPRACTDAVFLADFVFADDRGQPIPASLPWGVHLHAVVFSSWVALLVIQSSLVASGRAGLHRRLGMTAVVTDHGQSVARIISEAISLRQHVDVLRKVGAIA